MSTPTNISYTSETNLTFTLDTISSSATVGKQSLFVSNTTNKYLDAYAYLQFVTAATTSTGIDRYVYVYAYAGLGSDRFTYPTTGSHSAITITTPTNLVLVDSIYAPDTWTTYKSNPISIASNFGGSLPPTWGLAIINYTGMPLGTTNNFAYYVGVGQTIG